MGQPDPIILTLFSNRFMSIAEAMGRSLQQTAISTNIKERLDFSCALFSPTGDLVANAPFIPIHLGSMSFAVKYQLELLGDDLKEGDVIMTNSAATGGSHLPDITIITPCFQDGKIIFFTGSMSPAGVHIAEEGAEIISFKIVSQGVFNKEGARKLLVEDPVVRYNNWEERQPNSKFSGCRNFEEVLSDIRAQVAANHKGILLIHQLCKEYTLPVVQEYMFHIKDTAELAIRNLLKRTAAEIGNKLTAVDYMDDGSPICLAITINEEDGSAVFDFEGSGPEIRGCWNAPISVVHSASIYCLRALCGVDMPLNSGCLAPIDIKIPPSSLLSPSPDAAICGGNVVTSQRIIDVILRCFNACAASQGDCNNLTFGNDRFGYYETIGGGHGAGKDWEGTSGIHTNSTNTRITDAEIMERRYPVILHRFSMRPGSGGIGQHKGGDGLIRDIEFLEPLQVSILSERRVHQPYGLEGGGPGKSGLNLQIKKPRKGEKAGRVVNLGGKASLMMAPGDRFVIHTPGGGAWGKPSEAQVNLAKKTPVFEMRGSLADYHADQAGF